MKKKTKTYLLLMVVLIVWGIIGYQIFSRLNPSVEQTVLQPVKKYTSEKVSEQHFYSLQEEYRDPFLGGFPQKKKINTKKVLKTAPTVQFPNIVYNGMITGNKSTTFILTINGQQEILKLRETKHQVKLISANKERALVKFQGTQKTYLLKNR